MRWGSWCLSTVGISKKFRDATKDKMFCHIVGCRLSKVKGGVCFRGGVDSREGLQEGELQ